jgi:hypothetical protein
MAFNIRMGLPEMEALWNDLSGRKQQGKLDGDEEKLFKKLVKSLGCLAENPRHNSLQSHEIDDLTRKYGFKIFQSHLENRTPAAGRIFWAYGPGRGDITVLAIEPHPEDQKRGAYQRIKLSALPPAKTPSGEKHEA